jgi:hypothetical protein
MKSHNAGYGWWLSRVTTEVKESTTWRTTLTRAKSKLKVFKTCHFVPIVLYQGYATYRILSNIHNMNLRQ